MKKQEKQAKLMPELMRAYGSELSEEARIFGWEPGSGLEKSAPRRKPGHHSKVGATKTEEKAQLAVKRYHV